MKQTKLAVSCQVTTEDIEDGRNSLIYICKHTRKLGPSDFKDLSYRRSDLDPSFEFQTSRQLTMKLQENSFSIPEIIYVSNILTSAYTAYEGPTCLAGRAYPRARVVGRGCCRWGQGGAKHGFKQPNLNWGRQPLTHSAVLFEFLSTSAIFF